MKKLGKFAAMLLRRWASKTPKRARYTQYIVGGLGGLSLLAISIPTLGLPLWASLTLGGVAAISVAYEQIKDESDETVGEESRKIFGKPE